MTRGNQREKAREKNQKKQKEQAKQKAANDKSGNKGASMEQRRQRDADIMRQKQVGGGTQSEGAEGGK